VHIIYGILSIVWMGNFVCSTADLTSLQRKLQEDIWFIREYRKQSISLIKRFIINCVSGSNKLCMNSLTILFCFVYQFLLSKEKLHRKKVHFNFESHPPLPWEKWTYSIYYKREIKVISLRWKDKLVNK
jgi:hypothetical protein